MTSDDVIVVIAVVVDSWRNLNRWLRWQYRILPHFSILILKMLLPMRELRYEISFFVPEGWHNLSTTIWTSHILSNGEPFPMIFFSISAPRYHPDDLGQLRFRSNQIWFIFHFSFQWRERTPFAPLFIEYIFKWTAIWLKNWLALISKWWPVINSPNRSNSTIIRRMLIVLCACGLQAMCVWSRRNRHDATIVVNESFECRRFRWLSKSDKTHESERIECLANANCRVRLTSGGMSWGMLGQWFLNVKNDVQVRRVLDMFVHPRNDPAECSVIGVIRRCSRQSRSNIQIIGFHLVRFNDFGANVFVQSTKPYVLIEKNVNFSFPKLLWMKGGEGETPAGNRVSFFSFPFWSKNIRQIVPQRHALIAMQYRMQHQPFDFIHSPMSTDKNSTKRNENKHSSHSSAVIH